MAAVPVVPVRWQRDQPREVRTFEPLAEDHPLRREPCPACGLALGDATVVLLAVGPGDVDEQADHDAGRWYTADGTVVHQDCRDGFDPGSLRDA